MGRTYASNTVKVHSLDEEIGFCNHEQFVLILFRLLESSNTSVDRFHSSLGSEIGEEVVESMLLQEGRCCRAGSSPESGRVGDLGRRVLERGSNVRNIRGLWRS